MHYGMILQMSEVMEQQRYDRYYEEVGSELEYERWFEVPVRTDDGYKPMRELMQRVLTGKYAEHMHGQDLRFWQAFAYDREIMQEQLGDDVKPVGHMAQTVVFAAKILEAQVQVGESVYIAPQHVGLTLLAVATHDIGESMHPEIKEALGFVIGDIQRGKKTPLDRERETAIRRYVWSREMPELSEESLDFMEMVVAHKHEDYDDPSVRLGEAAHSIQSLDTAMRARQSFYRKWDEYVNGNDFSNRAVETYRAPAALYEQVCAAVIPESEMWAKEYEYVRAFRSRFMMEIAMFNARGGLLEREQPLLDELGEPVTIRNPRFDRAFTALQARVPDLLDRVLVRGVNFASKKMLGYDPGHMPRKDQEDLTIYPLNS